MESGYIYLLESTKNKRKYLGSTNNPADRIAYHNNGYVKSTKDFRPWKFLLILNVGSIIEARKIEYYIKRQKVKLSVENVVKILNWYFSKKGH